MRNCVSSETTTAMFERKTKASCKISHLREHICLWSNSDSNFFWEHGCNRFWENSWSFFAAIYPTMLPEGHWLYQDNDPKHTSRYIDNFFKENGIVWKRSPPESPDLNPIENIWVSLKQYLKGGGHAKSFLIFWQTFSLGSVKNEENTILKIFRIHSSE